MCLIQIGLAKKHSDGCDWDWFDESLQPVKA
jgi:hypothetical protein